MKKLKPGSQYKKDYKRFRNNPKKVEKLFRIMELLQNEEPIPEENRPAYYRRYPQRKDGLKPRWHMVFNFAGWIITLGIYFFIIVVIIG